MVARTASFRVGLWRTRHGENPKLWRDTERRRRACRGRAAAGGANSLAHALGEVVLKVDLGGSAVEAQQADGGLLHLGWYLQRGRWRRRVGGGARLEGCGVGTGEARGLRLGESVLTCS